MEISKARVFHDFMNGVVTGKDVSTAKKTYKEAKTFYSSIEHSIEDDRVMYEVYSYSAGDPTQVGNLNWGLTVMAPIYVNNECNMTRGHFHEDLDCAEFYFCLQGEGLLLFMDKEGTCFAEKMEVGSVHHIDGKYAHRLVNVGDIPLKVGACWPTTAGHDYKSIEEKPFTVRVFKENNEIVCKDTSE